MIGGAFAGPPGAVVGGVIGGVAAFHEKIMGHYDERSVKEGHASLVDAMIKLFVNCEGIILKIYIMKHTALKDA